MDTWQIVTDGGSTGKCGRLSQSSWRLGAL